MSEANPNPFKKGDVVRLTPAARRTFSRRAAADGRKGLVPYAPRGKSVGVRWEGGRSHAYLSYSHLELVAAEPSSPAPTEAAAHG